MSKISNFLSYKPLYGEDACIFYFSRLINTLKRDGYEKCKASKVNYVSDGKILDLERVLKCVENELISNLTDVDVTGNKSFTHIKSVQHSQFSHNLLGTKTWCKGLYNRYLETTNRKYLDYLEQGTDYILSKKTESGIIRYEQPLGLSQDEGPVTAGAIQVLCELFNLTKDDMYKFEAEKIAKASKQYLYDDAYGYLHTRGCRLCTTNINLSFAHAFALLYSITNNDEWLCETNKCIEIIKRMINSEGMFVYSNENNKVFVSLYHFMIVVGLKQIYDIYRFDEFQDICNRASIYGKKLINDSGLVIEPDVKQTKSLFRCCTRAALMYELIEDYDTSNLIISSLGNFMGEGRPYAECHIQDGFVTDGTMWYRRERHLADAYADLSFISRLRSQK